VALFEELSKALLERVADVNAVGFINSTGTIFPLGSDTKVLSTVFELASRPTIVELAEKWGYIVEEPVSQNHYPDFTLIPKGGEKKYIAIDIKTTYRRERSKNLGFTLGGYTSFIREENPTKNIVYPFDNYSEHWVAGFIYSRVASKKAAEARTYTVEQIKEISPPYKDVEVFLQHKWKIAGDAAGSGNTTNIGSIIADLDTFRGGTGIFQDEEEFLTYWRGYGRTKGTRTYSRIGEFRALKKDSKLP
jgi:ribosomal protein L20A (L18A)